MNTGDADGFATVQFLIDGAVRGDQTYLILAGRSIERSVSISVDDCLEHDVDMILENVWKA